MRTLLRKRYEIETKQYIDNGFYTGACFLKFAETLKVRQTLALKALSSYSEKLSSVETLVRRSMLSSSAKEDYIARFKDRLKALGIR